MNVWLESRVTEWSMRVEDILQSLVAEYYLWEATGRDRYLEVCRERVVDLAERFNVRVIRKVKSLKCEDASEEAA